MKELLWSLCLATLPLNAAEEGNVLFYTDPVQINAEVSPYESLTPDHPISGSIMITHDANLKVDESSFRMGNETIKVKFLNQVIMSPESKMTVSIYQFELSGKKAGAYNLPPITVNVGGKIYQAPPLNLTISP